MFSSGLGIRASLLASHHLPGSRKEVSLGPQSRGWFQKANTPGISESAYHHFQEEQNVLGSRASSVTSTLVTYLRPLTAQYSWLTRCIYRVLGFALGARDVTFNEIDMASVLSRVTFHGSQRPDCEYVMSEWQKL